MFSQTNQQRPSPTLPETPQLREFENYARMQMERDRIPGLTIGFLKDGATWVKAFGYADVENKTPALPDSAYRIASTTKPMTAAAILQLAERGKIDPDAEVQKYVPGYAKQKWPAKPWKKFLRKEELANLLHREH